MILNLPYVTLIFYENMLLQDRLSCYRIEMFYLTSLRQSLHNCDGKMIGNWKSYKGEERENLMWTIVAIPLKPGIVFPTFIWSRKVDLPFLPSLKYAAVSCCNSEIRTVSYPKQFLSPRSFFVIVVVSTNQKLSRWIHRMWSVLQSRLIVFYELLYLYNTRVTPRQKTENNVKSFYCNLQFFVL